MCTPWGIYPIPPLAGCLHPLHALINANQCGTMPMLWWVRSLNCAHGLRTVESLPRKLAQRGMARHMIWYDSHRHTNTAYVRTRRLIFHSRTYVRTYRVIADRRPYILRTTSCCLLCTPWTSHPSSTRGCMLNTLLLYDNRPHNTRQMR